MKRATIYKSNACHPCIAQFYSGSSKIFVLFPNLKFHLTSNERSFTRPAKRPFGKKKTIWLLPALFAHQDARLPRFPTEKWRSTDRTWRQGAPLRTGRPSTWSATPTTSWRLPRRLRTRGRAARERSLRRWPAARTTAF